MSSFGLRPLRCTIEVPQVGLSPQDGPDRRDYPVLHTGQANMIFFILTPRSTIKHAAGAACLDYLDTVCERRMSRKRQPLQAWKLNEAFLSFLRRCQRGLVKVQLREHPGIAGFLVFSSQPTEPWGRLPQVTAYCFCDSISSFSTGFAST